MYALLELISKRELGNFSAVAGLKVILYILLFIFVGSITSAKKLLAICSIRSTRKSSALHQLHARCD
jgi:hypothetical protein